MLKFKKLNDMAAWPKRANPTDSGIDICSCEELTINPGDHVLVSTGIAAKIPPGYEIQVRGRSGLASKGIFAHFGTVDESYTKEIKIILYNLSSHAWNISIGDRIAQLCIQKNYSDVELELVEDFEETERGGFGSTG